MKNFDSQLSNWVTLEKWALKLIIESSNLYYDRSVELVLFRRKIVDKSVSQVLNDHLYARGFAKHKGLNSKMTAKLAKEVAKLELAPSKIDIGVLALEWIEEGDDFSSMEVFIKSKLEKFIGLDRCSICPKDVVLYGFGRIGRLAARILTEQVGKGQQLRLKAIVVRPQSDAKADLAKRASLLRKDSVHGKMAGTVKIDNKNQCLIVNGCRIQIIYARNPQDVDYEQYGISNALVIDNTGVWRDREGLGKHLLAKGTSQVLLTAPGKDDILNVVFGINHKDADIANDNIFSAASCTTNAITPILKLLKDNYGIEGGHIETVHAFTNDQNLTDNYHKKPRRGRSASLNMVLTSTGANVAVTKIIPELSGKLTANAIRVPTPNVSMAILNIRLEKPTSKQEINDMFRTASLYGDLVEQIDYSVSAEQVSTDMVGNASACAIDSLNTIVSNDGKSAIIYAWYDNEYGYTRQVIRLAKHISQVRRLTYYSVGKKNEEMSSETV